MGTVSIRRRLGDVEQELFRLRQGGQGDPAWGSLTGFKWWIFGGFSVDFREDKITLPETNSKFAPENGGFPPGSLEIPSLETTIFRGEHVSFREDSPNHHPPPPRNRILLFFGAVGNFIKPKSSGGSR